MKVLDFGLAKVWTRVPQPPCGLAKSDLRPPSCRAGIMGTPAYMSPEQAQGQAADRRTDIWSFGRALRNAHRPRPFDGETCPTRSPHPRPRAGLERAAARTTPPPIRRLLRRCLEKDRKRRLADMADARLEIDDALSSPLMGLLPNLSRGPVSASCGPLRCCSSD